MKPRLDIHFPTSLQRLFLFGKEYIPSYQEFLLNHARSGILLALKALSLTQKAKVGVMAYNCHTVFNAIQQADLQPVFIDVTDHLQVDLNDLRNKKDALDALVISHLFGIKNDVASIRNEFPDLPIIEDCAHAYGLKVLSGDFTVFSLGQGKLPSIGNGGILVVNNKKYQDKVQEIYHSLPEYTFGESAKLYSSLLGKSLLYSPLLYSWFTAPMKRKRKAISGIEPITPQRMCKGISAIYRVAKEEMEKKIQNRMNRATVLADTLVANDNIQEVLPLGVNAFMLVVKCVDPSQTKQSFKTKGIETDTHFAHCIDWALNFGYEKGSCPNAERLTKQLLMIPTYD